MLGIRCYEMVTRAMIGQGTWDEESSSEDRDWHGDLRRVARDPMYACPTGAGVPAPGPLWPDRMHGAWFTGTEPPMMFVTRK